LILSFFIFQPKLKSIFTKESDLNNFITNIKQFCNFKASKITRFSFLTKLQKNCLITHRSRGVYSLFRLSRIKIKELA